MRIIHRGVLCLWFELLLPSLSWKHLQTLPAPLQELGHWRRGSGARARAALALQFSYLTAKKKKAVGDVSLVLIAEELKKCCQAWSKNLTPAKNIHTAKSKNYQEEL